MAKKENSYKQYGIATQAIHTGTDYDEGTGAVSSVSFAYSDLIT